MSLVKNATLLLTGAVLGALGKGAYDSKDPKKYIKDIANAPVKKIKNVTSTKKNTKK